MHFSGYLRATIYFQMPKQFCHQQSGSFSMETTQFSLCKQMKQLMKNTYSVNYCGTCTPQKRGSTDNVFFTCIVATALQSSSGMQSMDVIYTAHINTCRYAFRLVI